MRFILIIYMALAATWLAPHVKAAESLPVKSGRAQAQLVTSYDTAAPGQDIFVALSLRLEPHWHTYWRNAGGPGYPADVKFEILGAADDSLRFGDIIWPLPKAIVNKTGDPNFKIISYAFEDRLLLPIPLRISKNVKPDQVITIRAQATYLVCDEICLPEMAELILPLVIGEPVKDARWSANILRTLNNAPKPDNLQAAATLTDGKLQIDISGNTLDFAAIKNPYFFPYEQDIIEASAEQLIVRGDKGLRLKLKPSFGLKDGIKNVPGVLAFEEKTGDGWQKRGIVVVANADGFVEAGIIETSISPTKSITLWAALLSAFIGGIILNLMPCVFPVLSLKALGFAQAAHTNRTEIRKHGWFYTTGVLLSFITLAAIILVLKAGGASIGWGFQLQNPILVGALASLFFILALNLFGLFDIGGSIQNTGTGLIKGSGSKSAFFTGVLAVIVATPCTAPFMATALGFAFIQPAPVFIAVFLALGAGFALPFLALSYAPNLLARLPKPGPWMDIFKQFLAFPMLAAAIWLVWVISVQTGAGGVLRLLSAMLLFGFAVWLWKFKNIAAKLILLGSLLLGAYLVKELSIAEREHEFSTLPQASMWSPERIAELRAEGHSVFVDFTAAWCITCKANQNGVINKPKTQELFKNTNTIILLADWTRRDDVIAKELARHGRSGVPLYLVYPPGAHDVKPQILPQILTYGILENALEKAKQG